MSRVCRRDIVCVLLCGLLFEFGTAQAQSSAMAQSQAEPGSGPLPVAAVTAQKVAIQQQLAALAQSNLPKEDQDATRARFEQLLKVLSALEDTLQKRAALEGQLAALPKRLADLEAEHQTLAALPPRKLPQITEQLREDVEAQLHTIALEIQELNKRTAAGELRLATIAKDLEQYAAARLQLDHELLVARSQPSQTGGPQPADDFELLEFRLQLLQAEVDVLETEREWLTRRVPLQDALLNVAQMRYGNIQQDLETIKQTLEAALEQEQTNLSRTAILLKQQLEQTTDPLAALKLSVRLETVELQAATAEYRYRLNVLGDDMLTQENRNARVKQDVERLTSLVEKYTSGEGIAQRLLMTFEHLRLERLRYSDVPARNLEIQLQALTMQLFILDDQLYNFKPQVEARLATVSETLQRLPPRQRRDEVATLQQGFDDQKAALREQHQVLSTLLQDTTRLLTIHREYKRQLDDSYLFVLKRLFWLRDAKTLAWDTVQDMFAGIRHTGRRLQALLFIVKDRTLAVWSEMAAVWFLMVLVVVTVPWGIFRLWHSLWAWQATMLATSAALRLSDGLRVAAVLVLRAALWPGYIALIAWMLGYVLPQTPEHKALSMALVSGLQLSALTLGATLLVRTLLQPEGWGQRVWGLGPALCQFLRRLVLVSGLAVLLLLVPRFILLAAPGGGEVTVGSLALARFFFLAFQCVIVIVLWLLGRRSSPCMETLLARSRQRDGLWWRIWPFVHLLLMAAALCIVLLDVLGYRYAARFIWLHALASLSVVLLMRVLLALLVLRFLRAVVMYVFSIGGRLQQRYPDVEAAATRYFRLLSLLCHGLLIVLTVAVILELWGLSASWFFTSPLGTKVLIRMVIMAITLGAAMVIVQMSNALTDYLLQPRTTLQGLVRQPSRKLKTLAPLIQTLIKVGAIFAAFLVLLEQLGISTGPILAGVGIFGLAVGFASQSLIKDVINGLFILFEDSLSVGDVVTLRGIAGQVEKVTLRAVTIRDVAGTVHVIPNGTLDMIANTTKDYSRYVLDVGIAYRENVDEVIGLLRDIDESMQHDPVYSRDMLEPIEVFGLDRFEESAVIIRARLKTRPLQQWRIGREFNRRLKMVFDERGIEIPFPHRTVLLEVPKQDAQSLLRTTIGSEPTTRQENEF